MPCEEKLPPVTEAFLHTFIWKMSINCTENFVNICWYSLTITHGIGIIEILHEKDYFDNKTGRHYTAWKISAGNNWALEKTNGF